MFFFSAALTIVDALVEACDAAGCVIGAEQRGRLWSGAGSGPICSSGLAARGYGR